MTTPEHDDDPGRWLTHPADYDPDYYGPPDPPEPGDDPRQWLDPGDALTAG